MDLTNHSAVHHIMGTAIVFDIRNAALDETDTVQAVDSACERLREIDATFSTYRQDSEITRLGRGEISLDNCSADVRMIIDLCRTLRFSTNGFFDISAAAERGPARELQANGPHPSPIEPSGAVKGWAIEEAAKVLRNAGIKDFCLNAGGDIYASGYMAPGIAWRIGLQHPIEKMKVMAVLDVHDMAIATSGNYERGNHIVGVGGELISLTLVGHDMTLTDAYATAAFAMGTSGILWAADQPGFEVFAVDSAGITHRSSGIAELLVTAW